MERVEEVAGLDSLVVRWERELRVDAGAAFFGGVLEPAEQGVRVRDLEIVLAKLNFVLLEHVAVGDTLIVESEVVDAVDTLDVHGEAFEAVGELARHGLAVVAADLLEIGELGHFHAVAPDFPAEPPGAERRAFPIVLDKAYIVLQEIDARSEERRVGKEGVMKSKSRG